MSIYITTRAWDHSKATGASLLMILALSDRSDEDGVSWPGIDYLARKARVTPRQVQRMLQQLEACGEIYIERRAGRKHTNRYFVAIGLDQAEIERILERRYAMTPMEAMATALRLLELQGKGDADVTIPEPSQAEKGDTHVTNGDIPEGKGDIQGMEKVTPMSPDPSVNPSAYDPPEDSPEDPQRAIWAKFLNQLKGQMEAEGEQSRNIFRERIARLEWGGRTNGTVILLAPGPGQAAWLRERMTALFERSFNGYPELAGAKVSFRTQNDP